MFTDPFGLMGCDPKKDKDCELVSQVTAGFTLGIRPPALKIGTLIGLKVQVGLTVERGVRQTVDLNKQKVENEPATNIQAGAGAEITLFGTSFGGFLGAKSDSPGALLHRAGSPDDNGTLEVSGMVPVLGGILGPSATYEVNPAGAYLRQLPGMSGP